MISIKKLLTKDTEAEHVLMHVVRILIEGIGQHAAAGSAEDFARFRKSIKEAADALVENISPPEILVKAGSVLNALEDHNRRSTQHHRLQTAELQNIVKMLTATVTAVSAASNNNIRTLGEIERQIVNASELEDVRIMKVRLSDCLADIRIETERQEKQMGETIEQLSQGLDQARRGLAAVEEKDAVTGLPVRSDAEAALAQAGRGGPQAYAAVMVLDRLGTLNARFGRQAGDEVLMEFAGMVQRQLHPKDRLYRWSGPALLAFLPRAESLEMVRNEIGRIMETRLEHSIETPSRDILVPIAARWTVFPMMAVSRLLYEKIDTFAAQPTARD